MKKIAIKIIVLLGAFIICNNIIFSFFHLPFYWGNEVARTKWEYLHKHENEYNSLFIGASRTYYQSDLALFDSLTNHITHSFNFGLEGITTAEIFYYTDNLVKQDKNIHNVFIEICDQGVTPEKNLHNIRSKYWWSPDYWWFTVKYLTESNYGIFDQLHAVFYNTVSFCEWALKFDMLKDVLKFRHAKYTE